MQIPPQINTEIPQEALSQGPKTIPKDKLGLFSRLLEGLLRNSKTNLQGSAQIPEELLPAEGEALRPEDLLQAAGEARSAKKNALRGAKIAPFLRGGETAQTDEDPQALDGTVSAGKRDRKISTGESIGEEAVFIENLAEVSPKKEIVPRLDFGEESAAELPVEEAALPEQGYRAIPAGIRRDEKAMTGEDQAFREPEELFRFFSQETGSESVRLSPEGEKNSGDTENSGRTGKRRIEPGSRDRRRERGMPEVRDLRSGVAPELSTGRSPALSGESLPAIREAELRLELPGSNRAFGESPSGGSVSAAQGFEELLAGQLRGGLGDDIVRQASIILKDGGAGLIRLSLKPESLGNVKIRLEMAENKITGRIIVESNEALRAFEREIQSLEQAFRDSGFNGASIEMSVSSDNGNSHGNRGESGEEPGAFFSERLRTAAAGYESAGDFPLLGGNSGDPWASRPLNMLV